MSNQQWLAITGGFVVAALALWFAADATDGAVSTLLRIVAGGVIVGWLVFYLIDLKRDLQRPRGSQQASDGDAADTGADADVASTEGSSHPGRSRRRKRRR